MATLALVASTPAGKVREDEQILRGLRYLASKQDERGAIVERPEYVNYFTSVAVGAWAAAKVPEFARRQARARDFRVASQLAAGEGDPSYGGFRRTAP
jgi:hypothetical protein